MKPATNHPASFDIPLIIPPERADYLHKHHRKILGTARIHAMNLVREGRDQDPMVLDLLAASHASAIVRSTTIEPRHRPLLSPAVAAESDAINSHAVALWLHSLHRLDLVISPPAKAKLVPISGN